jgi:hypothetical protein
LELADAAFYFEITVTLHFTWARVSREREAAAIRGACNQVVINRELDGDLYDRATTQPTNSEYQKTC